uniref:XS domain-containing protein n=1 Tax=Kalanchoe fedtschenkoi TaxID=63787 RepID=A0A7N0VFY4_KALFE
MAGANHHHNKPPPSHRKSRWESNSAAAGDPKSQQPKPSPNPKNSNSHKLRGGGGVNNFNKKSASQSKPGPSPSSGNGKQQSTIDPTAPQPDPFPYPDLSQLGPPPQPTYGFHMLHRRTIVLADGTARSYFSLPPDYQDFAVPRPPFDGPGQFRGGRLSPEGAMHEAYGRGRETQDYWNSMGVDNFHGGSGRHGRGGSEGGLKRKFGQEERDGRENYLKDGEYSRQRQQLLQYGNPNSTPNVYHLGARSERNEGGPNSGEYRRDSAEPRSAKYFKMGSEEFDGSSSRSRQAAAAGMSNDIYVNPGRVDPDILKKEFLRFVKLINETGAQRKKYLEDGKLGSLRCVACGRSSKEFSDTHGLIMHTYHSDNADLLPDHLGLHKALCVLMGWNYSKPPDNLKSYQNLSAAEAAANQDDLIMWPPLVIIHNTRTGKNTEGLMEGLGNKIMDARLKELGFTAGKAKSLYGREGHLGTTLVKFPGDRSGLKEAIRLAELLEKENHGRKSWSHVESTIAGKDEEDNPSLVKLDEKGKEKKRILYGYLGTAADLDKVDFDTRKKAVIQSIRETLK